MRTGAGRIPRDDGSALIFVLWISVLLSVLLAGAISLSQQQARLAGAQRDVAGSDAALRSALELTAYDLALTGRSAIRDLPRTLAVGGRTIQVAVAPHQARLDVNIADGEAWQTVFLRAGLTPDAATAMSDRILDWRDNDERPRANGAERGDYPEDWPRPPANRGFVSVEELRAVAGMTDAVWGCVAPLLTVFGGTPPGDNAERGMQVDNSMTGVRVALRARQMDGRGQGRSIQATALYGFDERVAFQWVNFGEEDLQGLACGGESDGTE